VDEVIQELRRLWRERYGLYYGGKHNKAPVCYDREFSLNPNDAKVSSNQDNALAEMKKIVKAV